MWCLWILLVRLHHLQPILLLFAELPGFSRVPVDLDELQLVVDFVPIVDVNVLHYLLLLLPLGAVSIVGLVAAVSDNLFGWRVVGQRFRFLSLGLGEKPRVFGLRYEGGHGRSKRGHQAI